ncbi:MAG: tetrapyrrole methylase [Verrucomicrobiales bacterium]|nr:tetrapyrrole methylase [Verrucomicrobiales bacterium]
MKSKGIVYLVGAGPGDIGLLTLRGAELLKHADVVVYDALVNADLLRLAPKTAEFIYGGKRASSHAIPQSELNQLLIAKAREGKCVVRLKGGDPYTFGRGGEEAEELVAAKVPFEVVPGISSFVAVPNYAGIPLTHRDHSSSFTVVTGHEDPDKEEKNINWAQVAKTPGTKVILMGTERMGEIGAQLIEHGMAKDTPVAMVRWGTLGKQRSIDGTLSTIGGVIQKTNFGPPSVAIVGDVVTLRKKLNWFEKRSLFGKRIVVTRTREQASELAKELLERGADVLEIPTIKIAPPSNLADMADAIVALNTYSWIIFTSPNGVSVFFEHFFRAFDDLRDIGGVRIAAVGPATAAKLKELHLKVDVMPDEYVGKKIADALHKFESIENLNILLLRAEVANSDLPKKLEEMGAIVDDVACYKTIPETEDLNGAVARLAENGADWITFTSGSTVENFHARFNLPKVIANFPHIKLASIGPETSKAIVALGLKPTVEARQHTIEGLVKAIENFSS